MVTNTWNDMYIAINACNAVITRGPSVTGMDEKLKNVRIAEARLRVSLDHATRGHEGRRGGIWSHTRRAALQYSLASARLAQTKRDVALPQDLWNAADSVGRTFRATAFHRATCRATT